MCVCVCVCVCPHSSRCIYAFYVCVFAYVFAQCGMCVCASVCILYMCSYECTCMCGGAVCSVCAQVYTQVCVCVPMHMCMCVFFYIYPVTMVSVGYHCGLSVI